MKAHQWAWPLKADGTTVRDANGVVTGIYSSFETEHDEYGFEKSSSYDECCKRVAWIVEAMNRTYKIEQEALP